MCQALETTKNILKLYRMHEKNILVIDDDHDMLNLYHHYLKDVVTGIDLVFDPHEVLERLAYKTYHLVITDILMPGINGIDLTKAIHEHYPTLPILVCSEGGTTDAREIVAGIVMNKAISFGAIYALKKPFKKNQLLKVVDALLLDQLDSLKE